MERRKNSFDLMFSCDGYLLGKHGVHWHVIICAGGCEGAGGGWGAGGTWLYPSEPQTRAGPLLLLPSSSSSPPPPAPLLPFVTILHLSVQWSLPVAVSSFPPPLHAILLSCYCTVLYCTVPYCIVLYIDTLPHCVQPFVSWHCLNTLRPAIVSWHCVQTLCPLSVACCWVTSPALHRS